MMHPTIAASLRGFMPAPKRPVLHGGLVKVVYMGFDLTVELDSDGDIEGVVNSEGYDVINLWKESAMLEIETLVEKQLRENMFDAQFDRAAERAECES